MNFNQAVRHELVGQGREIPEALGLLFPNKAPFLPRILSGIQMKPSDARWLEEAPPDPEKKEVVFFMGCTALAVPDKSFALIDILERIGVDFAALIGGKLCCGVCDMFAGRLKEANSLAKDLIKNIKAFSPEKCVVTCPTCYDMLKNVIPQYVSFDFEVQFISTFLSDNLDRLKFTTPLNKKVTLHDPCPLSRGFKDDMSLRKVIKALPGVDMVEMEHNQQESLCCGSLAGFTYPEYAGKLAQALMEEGKAAKVDFMINACMFCHVSLSAFGNRYPFELTVFTSLVNMAQGGKNYEDKLKKYWGYNDLDKILEDAKECIEASNLDLDLLKQLLPVVFQLT
ncbi:MAG: (Fe-S)-binding protein [Deltaproteobacteria bacterium]|nr:(Fe-S)-binding protein [Deltaproteobacteria bacterium]